MESSRRLRIVGKMAIPRRIRFVDARDRGPAADRISSLSRMKFRQRQRGLRPRGSRRSPCRSRAPSCHPSRRPRLSGDLQRHRGPTPPNRSPRAPSEGLEFSGARYLAPVNLQFWNFEYHRTKKLSSMLRNTCVRPCVKCERLVDDFVVPHSFVYDYMLECLVWFVVETLA